MKKFVLWSISYLFGQVCQEKKQNGVVSLEACPLKTSSIGREKMFVFMRQSFAQTQYKGF